MRGSAAQPKVRTPVVALVLGGLLVLVGLMYARARVPAEFKVDSQKVVDALGLAAQAKSSLVEYESRVADSRAFLDRLVQKWPKTAPAFRDSLVEAVIRFESAGRLWRVYDEKYDLLQKVRDQLYEVRVLAVSNPTFHSEVARTETFLNIVEADFKRSSLELKDAHEKALRFLERVRGAFERL